MGKVEDWVWLLREDKWNSEAWEEARRGKKLSTRRRQAFAIGFVLGVVIAVVALIVGWAVSA